MNDRTVTALLLLTASAMGGQVEVTYEGKPLEHWVQAVASNDSASDALKAFEALDCRAEPAIPGLIELLKAGGGPRAMEARVGLGYIGSPKAVPDLIQQLKSADKAVRLFSCAAIEDI